MRTQSELTFETESLSALQNYCNPKYAAGRLVKVGRFFSERQGFYKYYLEIPKKLREKLKMKIILQVVFRDFKKVKRRIENENQCQKTIHYLYQLIKV